MINNYDELCSYDVVTNLPSNIKKISLSQNNSISDSYSVEIKNKSVSYSSDIGQENDMPIKVLKKISLMEEKNRDDILIDNNSNKSKSFDGNAKSENNKYIDAISPELTKPSKNKNLYKSPNKHYTINTKINTPIIEDDDDTSTSDTFSCSTYNTILSNLGNKYKTVDVKHTDLHIDTTYKKDIKNTNAKDIKKDLSPISTSSDEYSMTPETVDFINGKNREQYTTNPKQDRINIIQNKKIFTISYSSIVDTSTQSVPPLQGKMSTNKFCTYGSGTYSTSHIYNIEHMVPQDSVIIEYAIKLDSRLSIKNNIKFGIMVNGKKLKNDMLSIEDSDKNRIKKRTDINHIINKYDTISLYSESNLAEYSMSGFIVFRSNV